MKKIKKIKKIDIKKYNKLMDEIIKNSKNKNFEDVLFDLLETASKYELINPKKQQSRSKS